MALPKPIRRLTPEPLRNSVALRGLALGAGLIPPRTMHSRAESALLERLARGKRRVVEIGVYEGSSALVLAKVLEPRAELHLIDPFTANATLRPGQRGPERAVKRVVSRVEGGPCIRWHVALSQEVAAGWREQVDLVFIDGDHSQEGAQRDWDDWHGFVEPGGVVLFHDAREGRPGGGGLPGPTAVVDGLFRSPSPPPEWEIAEELDTAVAVRRLNDD